MERFTTTYTTTYADHEIIADTLSPESKIRRWGVTIDGIELRGDKAVGRDSGPRLRRFATPDSALSAAKRSIDRRRTPTALSSPADLMPTVEEIFPGKAHYTKVTKETWKHVSQKLLSGRWYITGALVKGAPRVGMRGPYAKIEGMLKQLCHLEIAERRPCQISGRRGVEYRLNPDYLPERRLLAAPAPVTEQVVETTPVPGEVISTLSVHLERIEAKLDTLLTAYGLTGL